jgi:glyoxylase-like metal-dependent hydrolase (beta-lactamase superfamily II)
MKQLSAFPAPLNIHSKNLSSSCNLEKKESKAYVYLLLTLKGERDMKTDTQLPESKHFRLQQLAEGVYAVFHIEGGAAISNAGIVDLGDRTLIFDTFMSPHAAEDLRSVAETLTGRPVDMVLNSHWHNDHIWGNQVFDSSTDIIGTEETRRMLIATKGYGAFDEFMAEAEANLVATQEEFQAAEDEDQRREISFWVTYHQAVVDTKPILQIRAPNVTFVERFAVHGTGRSVEMIPFSGGHTESDSVLFLPEEEIVFMSDLLFIDHHPYLGGGDPDSVLNSLETVSALAPRLCVPGHGPVGTVESLTHMAEYIHTMNDLARELAEEGATEEAINTTPIPEQYRDWALSSFFPGNMQYLVQRCLAD